MVKSAVLALRIGPTGEVIFMGSTSVDVRERYGDVCLRRGEAEVVDGVGLGRHWELVLLTERVLRGAEERWRKGGRGWWRSGLAVYDGWF